MKLTALIFSEWETEAILNLATSLLHDKTGKLSVLLVGDPEQLKESVVKLKKLSADQRLVARSSESDSSLEEGEEPSQVVFSYIDCKFGEVAETIGKQGPDLVIAGKHDSSKAGTEQRVLVRELFEKLPFRTFALRLNEKAKAEFKKVLVAVGGGIQSVEAIKLGARIVGDSGEAVCLLVVQPMGDLSEDVGRSRLGELVAKAGVREQPNLVTKVIVSSQIEKSIVSEAADCDLVILGATSQGSLKQKIFGTIPDKILSSGSTVAVGLIRAGLPFLSRLRMYTENILDLTVPQLDREDRIQLYSQVQKGAVWNFDFFALISLSTIIATLGLIQNSAAVIIGAMLVAPLMIPLLGAGLSIVSANTPLMRSSLKAVAYGFVVSLFMSTIIALMAVEMPLGSEILARTKPSLVDMAVAMFSGVAAAYCLARPGLSSALAGIAIAAALVPPVATAGIGLATGLAPVSKGAALLFSTNVVSIILGASAAFFGAGIRDTASKTGELKFTSVIFAVLVVVAVALLVPALAFIFQ